MTRKILYGVGVFIVFLMGLGLILNYLLPLFGVNKPLTSIPIIISFILCMIVVGVVYFSKKRTISKISVPLIIIPLIALPIMAVVGAELVNYYGNNIVLMWLIILLATVSIICMFTKIIPEKYWSFAIWMIALSIILHRVLISQDLWGADNIIEYGCYRVAEMGGIWIQHITNTQCPNYNTNLSVTILPLVLSKITFISGFWVFKLVLPLLLSVVPVAVYEFVKSQFDNKLAFLASFMVMASYPFFTVMLSTDKQLVAISLFSIFILMMVDVDIDTKFKPYLLGVLGVGIILSHYATAGLIIVILLGSSIFLRNKSKSLPILLPVALVVLWLAWYWFADNGSVIKQFVGLSKDATQLPIVTSPVVPSNAPIVSNGIASTTTHHSWAIDFLINGSNYMPISMLVFYIIMHLMIGVGILGSLWKWFIKHDRQIKIEYLIYCVLFVVILSCEILLPRFSTIFALDRIYPIYIIVLSPFVFIGFASLFRGKWIIVSSVFIIIFFLLNTGFIYELINKPLGSSIALSHDKEDFPVFTSGEVKGATWLSNNVPLDKIYYDDVTRDLFNYVDVTSTPISGKIPGNIMSRHIDDSLVSNNIKEGSYIFLRRFNVRENKLSLGYPDYALLEVQLIPINELGDFKEVLESGIVVYSNSDCKIIQTTEDYSE